MITHQLVLQEVLDFIRAQDIHCRNYRLIRKKLRQNYCFNQLFQKNV